MIFRGEVWWADLGERIGSRPAGRRPVLVVQADTYNGSRIATAVVAVISSNTRLADMPGNVFLPAGSAGLPRDSVVNVTAVATLDRRDLGDRVGQLSDTSMSAVDAGLARVLGLTAARN